MIKRTDNGYMPKTQAAITGKYDNGVGIATELFSGKLDEMYQKAVKGETEQSFQTGGASYTQTEWEKLLAEFDDTQEVMRKLMREEHERREEKRIEDDRLEDERLKDERIEYEKIKAVSLEYEIINDENSNVE